MTRRQSNPACSSTSPGLFDSRRSARSDVDIPEDVYDVRALDCLRSHIDAGQSIEGVPHGSPEDMLKLSLPPFYTACPNPCLSDFLSRKATGSDNRSLQPLTQDVSAGKNDPLYFAHYYSTKVPPDAIIPYILHYTEPGETVFDGFCGTGMTGVACQLCADSGRAANHHGSVGLRRAVLVDLSPAATFIAAGTNLLAHIVSRLDEIADMIRQVEEEHGAILSTNHVGWPRGTLSASQRKNDANRKAPGKGHIEYVVWSDVFSCSSCTGELVYWDLVFRGPGKPVAKELRCQHCHAELTLRSLERIWVSRHDPELDLVVKQAKQVPVLINYRVGRSRYEKYPDSDDLALLSKLDHAPLAHPAPIVEMPKGFNTEQPLKSHGFSHVHHFFTRRNLTLLSAIWHKVRRAEDPITRMAGLYLLTGMMQRVCRLNRYMPAHDRHVGPLSGTLYVSQLTAEIPATNYAYDRIADLKRCANGPDGKDVRISTQSATSLVNIPDESIDYIFTDPPFGGNLNYSELNTLVEAWIELRTDALPEAVVNDVHKKSLSDYQDLMQRSFREFSRVLRAGRWMTVEFHNSQNAVWTSIQEALTHAGFVVADVRTLDKQKGTTKQLSYGSAVKQDLIISAYKPNYGLEERFRVEAGTEEGVWDFVRTHLGQLPVFVSKQGQVEVVAERQNFLLFDRMVAFHVQRGVSVPLSAADFYAGLVQRYAERDGMYFLPDQVAEYDKKRMTVTEVLQLELFVTDEASAIQWLKQQLVRKPQTFQELHPQFIKEISGWQKHEKPLELSAILDQNFLRYDGKEEVPSQIHSYLSTNFKELRGRQKDDAALKAKAKDRWYAPDPKKAGDLEKLREKSLLKEFDEYKEAKGRQLKVFRVEAMRAGFKGAYDQRDYQAIVDIAERIPETVLQEDEKLLMYYDVARTRLGTDEDGKLF